MHTTTIFLTVFLLCATALGSRNNQPCYGSGGVAGVCISTSACTASGGKSISNACPGTPANIKCCSKPKCGSTAAGNCRWKSDCKGSALSNQCPGPSTFKCCQSKALGFGGYKKPTIPPIKNTVHGCKAVSVSGAKKVVAKFPGRIRQIGCERTCTCGASGASDHCCGKAVDLMCSDAIGIPTSSGKEIAEWVMNNRATLKLKYVIWGQRIWTVGKDKVMPWTSWRDMDDRVKITDNHWDHVHVSFK